MPLTPETLPKHELNGLYVRVVDAPNPDLVGIEGRIVVETMQTLHVEGVLPEGERQRGGETAESGLPETGEDEEGGATADSDGASRVRQVPKQGSTFEFALERRASEHADERADGHTDERADRHTDEAADLAKGSGIASKLDTGTTAESSGDAAVAGDRETDAADPSGEGVTYVTVDGTRLLSRPAQRTETRGDSPWQSD